MQRHEKTASEDDESQRDISRTHRVTNISSAPLNLSSNWRGVSNFEKGTRVSQLRRALVDKLREWQGYISPSERKQGIRKKNKTLTAQWRMAKWPRENRFDI